MWIDRMDRCIENQPIIIVGTVWLGVNVCVHVSAYVRVCVRFKIVNCEKKLLEAHAFSTAIDR